MPGISPHLYPLRTLMQTSYSQTRLFLSSLSLNLSYTYKEVTANTHSTPHPLFVREMLILAFKSRLCRQRLFSVLPHTNRNHLPNYLLPCFKHTSVVRVQKENPAPLRTHTPVLTCLWQSAFISVHPPSLKTLGKKKFLILPCLYGT